MDWLERLNQSLGRIPLGRGTVELLHWNYAAHLMDNRPHRHTFFEACLVGTYGQGDFIVRDRALTIGPGDLFVARPGVLHQIVNTATPNMELVWVSFGWTPGNRDDTDSALMRAFAQSETEVVPDDGQIAAVWNALRSVAGRGSREAPVRSLIAALILSIAQAASTPSLVPFSERDTSFSGERTTRLAVQFIHDNLAQPLPLSEIAAQISVSPRHLTRLFTQHTGHAPARYIAQARMDRARGLLLHSDLPIKEIAPSVGYPDVHHFTRAFRAAFGQPPGELRKRPPRGDVPNFQKPGALV